ncbi:hypothetical protein GCM10029964_006940 [Kibdelosporangium lantanae]
MNRLDRWLRAQRDNKHWHNTDAMYRAVVVGVGLIVAGVLVHQFVLVLFGAPLLLSAVIAVARPEPPEPTVDMPRIPRSTETGLKPRVVFDIDAPGVELIAIRAPTPPARASGTSTSCPGRPGKWSPR